MANKKVLVLEGSPRKGNTTIITDWILEGLGRRGVDLTRLRVCELNINGCQECNGCVETNGCQQDDDMLEVYDLLVDSDLTIWASPIFFYSFWVR